MVAKRAFRERRFTERQVKQPGPHERCVEAEGIDAVERSQKAGAPGAQGWRVALADVIGARDREGRRQRGADRGERGDARAGEDVGLHPIDALAIRLEAIVGHRDRLQRHGAARCERARARGEVRGHELEADGLEHLDRDHLGEPSGDVAVVAILDVDAVREARGGDACGGELVLLARHRDRGDATTARRCGVDRHAAPAAPDLEQMIAGFQIEELAQALVLRALRVGERRRGRREDAARVRERFAIEEQLVERVAEIVVRVDVALAAGLRVRRAAMAQERWELREAGERRFEAVGAGAGHERADHGDEVIALPLARDERFAGAHLAAQQHAEEQPVVTYQRARCGTRARAELEHVARGQRELEVRPLPGAAQPVQRRPSQQPFRRRQQPRQRDDQRMNELGHRAPT